MIYSASWLLPISGPPLKKGQLLVRGPIVEVVGTDLTKRHPAEPKRELGDAILMPGFVNAHSHLDYSLLKGAFDGEPFLDWIKRLGKFAVGSRPEDRHWSAMLGVAEMIKAGITSVGDSAPYGDSARVVSESGLRGTVYLEIFGLDPRADYLAQVKGMADTIADLRGQVSDIVRVGLSPHTAYTAGPELLKLTAQSAEERNLPLMIHLAETRAEMEFCKQGTGPIAVWRPHLLARRPRAYPGKSPAAYLAELGVLSPNCLLSHCVHCDEEDIETISKFGAAIVHCPRSNCLLGSGMAPVPQMLDARLRVGLGTDSAASNLDLDLLNEARFALALHRGHKEDSSVITPEAILRIATRGGAEALGLERVGCLAPGWAADFIAIRVGDPDSSGPMCCNLYSKLIFGGRTEVVLSVVAGREILADGGLLTVDEAAVHKNVRRVAASFR